MTLDSSESGRGRGGPFGMRLVNAAVLGAAVIVIILGYVLLDHGSITAAPILLALGYVVLIPAGILIGYRRVDGQDS